MKSFFIFSIITAFIALPIYADFQKVAFGTQEGNWIISDNRYIQEDEIAPRAKAWVKVNQDSDMVYEFTMRYEGGIEDGHGGVGLHILADQNLEKGISWGLSDSWLFWLNYDVSPGNSEIPRGLSAQVYKSRDDSNMELFASIPLNQYEEILESNLDTRIPVSIRYYSGTGRVTIADPTGDSMGWYVDLPDFSNETGSYVAARTNGVAVSFTSPAL